MKTETKRHPGCGSSETGRLQTDHRTRRRKGNQPLGRKSRHGTKFVNGLRVTDDDTMEVAEMVLNKVNKELVTGRAPRCRQWASVEKTAAFKCEKKLSNGEDIGYVGNVTT